MPSTLEDIQRKHEEAMTELRYQAIENMAIEEDRRAMADAIEKGEGAFAELLEYHKRVKAATGIAVEIERAKQ
jgi:hypothetical protein